MRKHIALLLAIVMLAGLAAGCASQTATASTGSASQSAAAPAASASASASAAASASASAASSDTAAKGGYTIALCNNSLGETWRVQMVAEFHQAADALVEQGVLKQYYETNADADASKQIADMEDLIAKGVDGILIAPQNPTALNDIISEAMDAGIKVVVFNSACDESFTNYTSYVYQDNYEFGKINAEFLVNALNGKGKIIALQGVAGVSINAERWQGAKDVFDQYPDIEVVGEANGNWDYADGKAATEALLSANPVIDGVWSQGGAMTQGAIDAFIAAGRPLVPMSGESGNGFMASWKKYQGVDNFSSCAPIYDPAMVVDAMDVLVKALNGETVEQNIKLPMDQVTTETLDQYYRPDLPDSYWAGSRLTEENLQKLFAN